MIQSRRIIVIVGIAAGAAFAHCNSVSNVSDALKARLKTIKNVEADFEYNLQLSDGLAIKRTGMLQWEKKAIRYEYESNVTEGSRISITKNLRQASASANYDHNFTGSSGVISPIKTLGQGMTIDGLTTLEGGGIDLTDILDEKSNNTTSSFSALKSGEVIIIKGTKAYGPGRGTDFNITVDPQRQYAILQSRWSHFFENNYLTTSALSIDLTNVNGFWIPTKTKTVTTAQNGKTTTYTIAMSNVKVNNPSYKRDHFVIPEGTVVQNALDNKNYTLKRPATVSDILSGKVEPNPDFGLKFPRLFYPFWAKYF